eukprot:gene15135-biopygen13072
MLWIPCAFLGSMPESGPGRLRPPGLAFLSQKTGGPDLMGSGGGAGFPGHVTAPPRRRRDAAVRGRRGAGHGEDRRRRLRRRRGGVPARKGSFSQSTGPGAADVRTARPARRQPVAPRAASPVHPVGTWWVPRGRAR